MPENQDEFHGLGKISASNLLRKLHRNAKSNIPALMAQRAMGTFSLQAEPPPHEASSIVFVVVYPQNPFVSEPEIRKMLADDIQAGLINSRIQIISDTIPIAEPDEEGNYLYWKDTPQFDQVSAIYYATLTLRMWERYAHRTIPWAFPHPRLLINPHIGEMANAFYNEQERLLGFHNFKVRNGDTNSTAQSADIVAHETAHAVLDGIRDLYNESFGLGARAFHESFGDITAMLIALHDDSLVRRMLEWTQGDLRMSNFVTEVAEHLTDELANSEYLQEHTVYLRNAFNMLKSVPFDDMEYDVEAPLITLSRQEHNYSRLFTGAIYDIFAAVYERFLEKQPSNYVAIYRARDVIGQLVMLAVELAPIGEMDFGDMARAMLTADDIAYHGNYSDLIKSAFVERDILSDSDADAHLKSLKKLPDLDLPDTLNTALSAAMYFEQVVRPTLDIDEELLPVSTYRNANGYTFMAYFSSRKMRLQGDQYEEFKGADIDVFGGLTLMWDANSKLRSVVYRPVTDEDLRQIGIIIADWVENDKIANDLLPIEITIRPHPRGLHIPHEQLPEDTDRIIKYPVIFDDISETDTGFYEYLKTLQQQAST